MKLVWGSVCAIASFVAFFALNAPCRAQEAALDRSEAKKAYEYLNKVRQGPADYSQEYGVDLSDVEARSALKWHGALAKVAEEKARDMADREYFAHVNPEGIGINILIHEAGYKLPDFMIENKSNNYFESLSAGNGTGVQAVKSLIIDQGTPSLGHRKHLLGIEDFRAKHTHIGVGCARKPDSKYGTYWCFIIADTNQPVEDAAEPADDNNIPPPNNPPANPNPAPNNAKTKPKPGAPAPPKPAPAPAPAANPDKIAQEVVRLVNAGRTNQGVAALQTNSALTKAAQRHARVMTQNDGQDEGFKIDDVLQELNYEYAAYTYQAGGGYGDAQAIYKSISQTEDGQAPGIFSEDYAHIGVAVAKSADGTPYFSLIMAKPQE